MYICWSEHNKAWKGSFHDDVIIWKHFPRYWSFVMMTSSYGNIFRVTGHLCREFTPVNSPHKGRWRRALMFSLICVWINCWLNNGEAGDSRRYRVHYDVTIMVKWIHRSPMDSLHIGQWRGAFMFSLMCAWTNDWANSLYAGDLRRHGAYCDVTLMWWKFYPLTHCNLVTRYDDRNLCQYWFR